MGDVASLDAQRAVSRLEEANRKVREAEERAACVEAALADTARKVAAAEDELAQARRVELGRSRLDALLAGAAPAPEAAALRAKAERVATADLALTGYRHDHDLLTQEQRSVVKALQSARQVAVEARDACLQLVGHALVRRWERAVDDIMADVVIPMRAIHDAVGDRSGAGAAISGALAGLRLNVYEAPAPHALAGAMPTHREIYNGGTPIVASLGARAALAAAERTDALLERVVAQVLGLEADGAKILALRPARGSAK